MKFSLLLQNRHIRFIIILYLDDLFYNSPVMVPFSVAFAIEFSSDLPTPRLLLRSAERMKISRRHLDTSEIMFYLLLPEL